MSVVWPLAMPTVTATPMRHAHAIAASSNRLTYAPDVLVRDHESVIVLLDLRSGRYVTLDEIGRLAWLAVGRGATIEQIVASLDGQISGLDRHAADEIREFLTTLLAQGLLAASGETGTTER